MIFYNIFRFRKHHHDDTDITLTYYTYISDTYIIMWYAQIILHYI